MADDKFTRALWSCKWCQHHGESRPWVRDGETAAEAVARFQRETRERCSKACQFVATLWQRDQPCEP